MHRGIASKLDDFVEDVLSSAVDHVIVIGGSAGAVESLERIAADLPQ